MYEFKPLPQELQLPVEPLHLSPEKEMLVNAILKCEQEKMLLESIIECDISRAQKRKLLREHNAKLRQATRELSELARVL